MEIIKPGTRVDFIKWMKPVAAVSILLFLAALALILFKGFNYSIDFAGGVEMRVEFPPDVTIDRVRDSVSKMNFEGIEVISFLVEGKNVFSIKAKGEQAATAEAAKAQEGHQEGELPDVAKLLFEKIQADFGADKVAVVSTDLVGPRVGKDLRKKGVLAIVYALVGIMVYVGWRFNFRYAPGALVSLAHDVIIIAGVCIVLDKEMSLQIIAVLLTIAGYSVNDTVVIFDRIREGGVTYRGKSVEHTVNESLNDTLSRTILTGMTTLAVLLVMYFLGSEITRDFAELLLIGIVIGTYSSVFVASPVYIWLEKKTLARRKAQKKR